MEEIRKTHMRTVTIEDYQKFKNMPSQIP